MKASLQLKMGQQLTMTPQLQQAIRLLQLSTLDLQQEIQEALDSNPMLESEEHGPDDIPAENAGDNNSEAASGESAELNEYSANASDSDSNDVPEAKFPECIG